MSSWNIKQHYYWFRKLDFTQWIEQRFKLTLGGGALISQGWEYCEEYAWALHEVKLLFLAHATDNYFWQVESIRLAFSCFVKESLFSDTFDWFYL